LKRHLQWARNREVRLDVSSGGRKSKSHSSTNEEKGKFSQHVNTAQIPNTVQEDKIRLPSVDVRLVSQSLINVSECL